MLKRITLALAAVLPLAMATPAHAQNTIADIVVRASGGATAGTFDQNWRDYDLLLNALTTANLVGAVSDPNASLTVFAPSDLAFFLLARDLGYTGTSEEGTWNFLVATLTQLGNGNPVPILTNILLYHVAPGVVGPLDLLAKTVRRETIDTLLAGATIRPFFLQLIDNEPQLRNPFVTFPINLRASNGVIHGITRVLIPVDLP